MVLVMTVAPGFGGQPFLTEQLGVVETVRRWVAGTGRAIDIEVDGGIVPATARQAVAAGADLLVSGSYIFGHDHKGDAVAALRDAVA